MKKIFIILFVLSIAVPVQAEILNLSSGKKITPATDRAMSQDVNLNAIQKAFDAADPRSPIKEWRYDAGVTYKIRLREFMASVVELPRGEEVADFILGDESVFSFIPLRNNKHAFTLSAKYPGGDTSLVVFGKSGRVYTFYLRCDTVKSTYIPNLTTRIVDESFVSNEPIPIPYEDMEEDEPEGLGCDECKKDNPPKLQSDKLEGEYLHSLPDVDMAKLNFNYTTSKGDASLNPLRIFDDSHFTRFQFPPNVDLPVIYMVKDGYDTPINSRVEVTYAPGSDTKVLYRTIVAEAINPTGKWTIRSGEIYLCVRKTDG
ncbi:TrbG/VirB9 family P-type conjugative transfer protein [Desulfovibrio ferrophilus]|uniref:ComB2 protein n=1 Tax=Desulfovibrio ferrophilus TaxID=241368 RepID=A0A2Z6B3T4_9BACT|nr:TrbG/VirB9 family P-type conjugative transfer protein [Desulfovibrio ferrophilus]BBD10152.1 ComB2 protein [Desulfovibrio ferrophilus]